MMCPMVCFLLLSVAAGASNRYCVACERIHASSRWHKASGARICHRSFMRWGRDSLPGPVHPGHIVLHRYRNAVDVTGRRIVALRYRVDTVAFQTGYMLMSSWSMAQRLFLMGIIGQLYWTWPIISALTLAAQRPFDEVCVPSALLEILRYVKGLYGAFKVQGGVLQVSRTGRSPLSNPSERVSGVVRYRKLARQCEKWYEVCVALAGELSRGGPGMLQRLLRVLKQHPTRAYPGRSDYGHIRICRLMMYAVGVDDTDSATDWLVYRCCSKRVKGAFQLYRIHTHDDALRAVDFMRRILDTPEYNFSDLTAYVCLMGSMLES